MICLECFQYGYAEEAMKTYKTIVKSKFEEKFRRVCSRYKFYDRYKEILLHPRQDYMIFVYQEARQKSGGIGDRLAGMITAIAYAIRSNRNFLIAGDDTVERYFKPYDFNIPELIKRNLSYSRWEWANWERYFGMNITKLKCVNPNDAMVSRCALDVSNSSDAYKTIKYYGNRAYLCRWVVKSSLMLQHELMETLGISIADNLYEVAGCMLRLVFYPTEELWNSLDEMVRQIRYNGDNTNLDKAHSQIGIHFRCGDTSFHHNSNGAHNPECYYSNSTPWRGTRIIHDFSMDSPLALAQCGAKIANGTSPLVYIASDNYDTAQQIIENIQSKDILYYSNGSCHIDYNHDKHCTDSTLTQWFLLAISDEFITQSLMISKGNPSRADSKAVQDLLLNTSQDSNPASGFSRYAYIYSLSSGHLRHGDCDAVNGSAIALQTNGNWLCDPKRMP